MSNLPPLEQAPANRTFVVAVVLLVVVALLQTAAFFWVFLSDLNRRTLQAGFQQTESLRVETAPALDTEEIVTGLLSRIDGSRAASDSMAAQPTPVPSTLTRVTDNPMLEELITVARAARERGDIPAAFTKLREAMAIAPNSIEVVAEMAYTHEAIGSVDKAVEQWRRVFEAGPSVGVLYNMAEMKLKSGVGSTAATKTADALFEEVEFQEGSSFALAGVKAEEILDPGARRRILLNVPAKVRQGVMIDPRNVVLGVYFYDLVDNEHVVQTTADVTYEWLTPPADWADDGMETLRATYVLPAFSPEETELSQREYLGYIVRLYYNNELQDVRAEPVRLLNEFPPPLRLESEEEPLLDETETLPGLSEEISE